VHVVMQAGREGSRVDGSHNRDDIYRAILAINHDGWQPPAAEDSLSFLFPYFSPIAFVYGARLGTGAILLG